MDRSMKRFRYRHVSKGLTAWRRGAFQAAALGLVAWTGAGCERSEKEFLDPNAGRITEFAVWPRNAAVNQLEPLTFEAFGKTVRGDSAAVAVDWRASGGLISEEGVFESDLPGQYWIVARAQKDPALVDSVVVSVLSPKAAVSRVVVSPSQATLTPGESISFSSQPRTANGALADVPVVWTASAGTIDLQGVYTAPSEDTDVIVIASIAEGVADTARVIVRTPLGLKSLALAPGVDSMFAGETRPFSVSAEWTDGRTQVPEVDFSATGGVVDGMGIYTAGDVAGEYEVVVRERNGSLMARARLWIVEERVASIRLRPASVHLLPGATHLFSASAHAASGRQQPVAIRWSATGGAITEDGRFTAGRTPGTYRVIAASGGAADTATVVVGAPRATLASIGVVPQAISLPAGGSHQFTASGSWSDGSEVVPSVEWMATGGTISSDGEFVAGPVAGTYRVIARHRGGSLADTSLVTVGAARLSGLEISPGGATVERGRTVQFSVRGQLTDGTQNVPPVSWAATGGTINTSGLFTAGQSTGTYRVIARHADGIADTIAVTITSTAAVLTGLTVSPGSVSLVSGAVQTFRVTAEWTNGGTGTPFVIWSATGGQISSRGRFVAGSQAGTYRIVARQALGTIADTATVTITPPAPQLTGLTLSPSTATVQAGGTRQFTVSATWTGGGAGVPPIVWSATGGTVESNGLYRAGSAAGTFRVIARQQDGTLADTSVVTVTSVAPQLVGIDVTPEGATVATGGIRQFSVSGVWTNGGSGAPAVLWSATGGTISSSGRYTAGTSAGTYRVIARQQDGSLADTVAVIVSSAPATLTSLRVQPRGVTLQTGLTQQYSVEAGWSNGANTIPEVTWSATGGTITSGGRYTAPSAPGTYRIVARHTGGSLADSTTVNVSAPTVTRLSLTPETSSLVSGTTQQFQTSATWSDGASRAVAVTYTATGGTITVNGLYTAGRNAGTFLVIAACSCGQADTSRVTITGAQPAPVLASVAISPSSLILQPGTSQQLSALPRLTDGTTGSATVSWSASGGSITSSGQYTAGPTPGSYRVIASVSGGAIADTIPVTIQVESSPPPSGGGQYPNRPANYTRVLNDYGFNDPVPTAMDGALGSSGWAASWNSAGLTRRGTASDAPVSPSSVLEWAFTRAGTVSGGGVGNIGRGLPSVNQIYVAFWMKHDSQFEFHPISNKLLYLEPGNLILQTRMWESNWFTINNGGGGGEYRATGYTLPLGRWVQVEYLVDAVNNRIRLWADGRLVVDVAANLAGGYRELKLDSTWGGSGGTKTRDSFRWIDHILVATP